MQRRLAGRVLAAVGGSVALLAGTCATGIPARARPVSAHAPIRTVGSAITGDLFGVSALTPTDAWAVGDQGGTLIVHWNGRTWSRVKSPSPGVAVLEAVGIRSPNDGWAVGFYSRTLSSPGKRLLILHWNGSAWSVARSGVLGKEGTQLAAVTAVSEDDAWAVGQYCPTDCFNSEVKSQALILHWNGTSWARVRARSPCGGTNYLHGVAASGQVAWAVGECDSPTGGTRCLLLRWNGARWSASAGPDLDTAVNFLWGVTAVSASAAWAVGEHYLANGSTQATLILRWNGRKWSRVPSPDPGLNQSVLTAVSAVSATRAWAAGFAGTTSGQSQILALRWNGSTWAPVPTNATGPPFLVAVSTDTAKDAWIVGIPNGNSCARPLMLHWTGSAWTQSC